MLITKYKHIEIQPWCKDGLEFKGTFLYGMCYWLDAKQPYFCIKGETSVREKGDTEWYPHRTGHLHDLIDTHAPSLSELLSFDFWGQDGLRLHYSESLMYLYECYRGWWKPKFGQTPAISKRERQNSRNRFREIVLLAPGERIPFIKDEDDMARLHAWLDARRPYLQSRFHQAMQKFKIECITEEAMQAFNQDRSMLVR